MVTNSTPPKTPPTFLTPKQLAERWQCSLMKLRRMRRARILPVCYIGRHARYSMTDVLHIEQDGKDQ